MVVNIGRNQFKSFLLHKVSILALSVFAAQIHLSQRERPWHSGKVSGQTAKFVVSPEALPLGELAKPQGFD